MKTQNIQAKSSLACMHAKVNMPGGMPGIRMRAQCRDLISCDSCSHEQVQLEICHGTIMVEVEPEALKEGSTPGRGVWRKYHMCHVRLTVGTERTSKYLQTVQKRSRKTGNPRVLVAANWAPESPACPPPNMSITPPWLQ